MQLGTSAPRIQEIGGLAEDFTLPGVNGGQIHLAALLKAKQGAVVVFWSGVCSHCIRYDGYLNSFAERDIHFPIAHDQGSLIARRWSTEQTPRAFLMDSGRVLLYRGA